MSHESLLDLDRLRASSLRREPFDFLIVEDFVARAELPALVAGFPELGRHGSYPLNRGACGPAFARLVDALEGDGLREAIARKFAVDLADRPTMITLRGYSDGKDGRIHTDSSTKIITLLLYMNLEWDDAAGRLRVLRGPGDLDDYAAEVPPLAGTMLAFRRSDASFHGHRPHIGRRQVVQLNWVTDRHVVERETRRHAWSARIKALNPFR